MQPHVHTAPTYVRNTYLNKTCIPYPCVVLWAQCSEPLAMHSLTWNHRHTESPNQLNIHVTSMFGQARLHYWMLGSITPTCVQWIYDSQCPQNLIGNCILDLAYATGIRGRGDELSHEPLYCHHTTHTFMLHTVPWCTDQLHLLWGEMKLK